MNMDLVTGSGHRGHLSPPTTNNSDDGDDDDKMIINRRPARPRDQVPLRHPIGRVFRDLTLWNLVPTPQKHKEAKAPMLSARFGRNRGGGGTQDEYVLLFTPPTVTRILLALPPLAVTPLTLTLPTLLVAGRTLRAFHRGSA